MTENKRFIVKEDSFTDKVTKKTYCELSDIIDLCNRLWKQTQRFEKHNQKLMGENLELYRELKQLKEQIIIYEEFLKSNNLDIEWDLFCTADICNEEDIDCKYCKYMRWKE